MVVVLVIHLQLAGDVILVGGEVVSPDFGAVVGITRQRVIVESNLLRSYDRVVVDQRDLRHRFGRRHTDLRNNVEIGVNVVTGGDVQGPTRTCNVRSHNTNVILYGLHDFKIAVVYLKIEGTAGNACRDKLNLRRTQRTACNRLSRRGLSYPAIRYHHVAACPIRPVRIILINGIVAIQPGVEQTHVGVHLYGIVQTIDIVPVGDRRFDVELAVNLEIRIHRPVVVAAEVVVFGVEVAHGERGGILRGVRIVGKLVVHSAGDSLVRFAEIDHNFRGFRRIGIDRFTQVSVVSLGGLGITGRLLGLKPFAAEHLGILALADGFCGE